MSYQKSRLYQDKNIAHQEKASQLSHWILWLSFSFLIIAIAYASIIELDEVTVATGKVIPSDKVQVIQNLEGGILRNIAVKEGDFVTQGQLLMTLDDTQTGSSYRESLAKQVALTLAMQRLQAQTEHKVFTPSEDLQKKYPELVVSEHALHKTLIHNLKNQIYILRAQREQKKQELSDLNVQKVHLSSSYDLISKELALLKPLVQEGIASEMEMLRLQRQVNDVRGQLDSVESNIPRTEQAINEINKKIKQTKLMFESNSLENLIKVKSELAQIEESSKGLKDRFIRTAIKSPVDGTVKKIDINTLGGVVKPGMDLMRIVPTDSGLLIQAQVKPADIAFLHPGQSATVKLTAYDFSIYGTMPAELKLIGADTLTDQKGNSYYEIQVKTKGRDLKYQGKSLPIIPGMMASVDVLTGHKTIMNYLLKPILKTKENAMHER